MNKKQITVSTLSIFTSALFFTSTVFANEEGGIYKWVDARGVTNYSETPPDAKDTQIKAQSININRYVPRGSEEAINNLQKQRSEKAEAEKEAKSGKEGVKKTSTSKTDVSKASAQDKEKCAQLKQDLSSLTEKGSAKLQVKEADGKIRTLNADEIAKRTESTKSQIKIYCE